MSRPTSSQWPLQHLDLVAQELDVAHRVPHVGVARDRAQRLLLARAADQDRQALLDRRRQEHQLVERVVAARRRRDASRRRRARGAPRPTRPSSRGAGRSPTRTRSRSPGARARCHAPPMPRDRAAAAGVVDRRQHLRDDARVAERVRADEQAEPDVRRDLRPRREASCSPRRWAGTGRRRSRTGGPRPTGCRSRARRRGARPPRTPASPSPGSRAGCRAWWSSGTVARRARVACGAVGAARRQRRADGGPPAR